jgi:hypothetical protein
VPRAEPWAAAAFPPVGTLLCGVCAKELARRRCRGEGCGGALYCAPCFIEYHPPKDDAWAPHWRRGAPGGYERLEARP